MSEPELSGTYTYRSFLNRPEPVEDFNKLRFAELELRLFVDPEGAISGELVFPGSLGAEPCGDGHRREGVEGRRQPRPWRSP